MRLGTERCGARANRAGPATTRTPTRYPTGMSAPFKARALRLSVGVRRAHARQGCQRTDRMRRIDLISCSPYFAESHRSAAGGAMATLDLLPHTDPELSMLGGFRLLSDTGEVAVPRTSQRLLAFLALHGGLVNRAGVAG